MEKRQRQGHQGRNQRRHRTLSILPNKTQLPRPSSIQRRTSRPHTSRRKRRHKRRAQPPSLLRTMQPIKVQPNSTKGPNSDGPEATENITQLVVVEEQKTRKLIHKPGENIHRSRWGRGVPAPTQLRPLALAFFPPRVFPCQRYIAFCGLWERLEGFSCAEINSPCVETAENISLWRGAIWPPRWSNPAPPTPVL